MKTLANKNSSTKGHTQDSIRRQSAATQTKQRELAAASFSRLPIFSNNLASTSHAAVLSNGPIFHKNAILIDTGLIGQSVHDQPNKIDGARSATSASASVESFAPQQRDLQKLNNERAAASSVHKVEFLDPSIYSSFQPQGVAIANVGGAIEGGRATPSNQDPASKDFHRNDDPVMDCTTPKIRTACLVNPQIDNIDDSATHLGTQKGNYATTWTTRLPSLASYESTQEGNISDNDTVVKQESSYCQSELFRRTIFDANDQQQSNLFQGISSIANPSAQEGASMGNHEDWDDNSRAEILETARKNFAEYQDKIREYEFKEAAGVTKVGDGVKQMAYEKRYINDFQRRLKHGLVDDEEREFIRNQALYKTGRRDLITAQNFYRSWNTELEHEKDCPKKRKAEDSPVDKPRVFKKSSFNGDPWRIKAMVLAESRCTSDSVITESEEVQSGMHALSPTRTICRTPPIVLESPRKSRRDTESVVFPSTKTSKAFTDMTSSHMAQVPRRLTKQERENKKASDIADRQSIKEARAFFSHGNKPKRDEVHLNMWKVPRMQSTLADFQVIGAGWIKKQEQIRQDTPTGGIFADTMGFGKTVQMLTAILDGPPSKKEAGSGEGPTLIVVPGSLLLEQWDEEIKKHCKPDFLGLVVSFKSSQALAMSSFSDAKNSLEKAHIILTTYREVSDSYPKESIPSIIEDEKEQEAWWYNHFETEKGLLHHIQFRRIVLDEAQKVKNITTKGFRAVKALRAHHRWVVTGTPICDNIEEVYAYSSILLKKYTGDLRTFRQNYCNPENADHPERLRVAMTSSILRRTHEDELFGKCIMTLPKSTTRDIVCELSSFEKELYHAIIKQYEPLVDQDGEIQNRLEPGWQFSMMMTLRQVVAHPLLVQSRFEKFDQGTIDELHEVYNTTKERNPREKIRNLQHEYGLHEASGTGAAYGVFPKIERYLDALPQRLMEAVILDERRCNACDFQGSMQFLTPCGHQFCTDCIETIQELAGGGSLGCLKCDQVAQIIELNDEQIFRSDVEGVLDDGFRPSGKGRKIAKRIDAENWLRLPGIVMPSSKTLALKVHVLDWIAAEPDVKIIVFTQWKQLLEILSGMFRMEGWTHCEIHGEMTPKQRQKAVKAFTTDPKMRILAATIHTTGVGLNLTAATKAIIMDPWWNDASDKQAIARIWRMGQTRETECVRLYARGTIDDRITRIRDTKSERIAQILEGEMEDVSIVEMLRLFGPKFKDEGPAFIYPTNDHVPKEHMKKHLSQRKKQSSVYNSDDSEYAEEACFAEEEE